MVVFRRLVVDKDNMVVVVNVLRVFFLGPMIQTYKTRKLIEKQIASVKPCWECR